MNKALDAFYGADMGELTLRDTRRLTAALQAMWEPIETAPRGGRILLYRPSCPVEAARVVLGWYDASNRRPYWAHDLQAVTGIKDARRHPPTHWCPVTPPHGV